MGPKPKQTSSDIVNFLKTQKGVTFSQISEADARKYLHDKNNFFRTASYRKNYDKYSRGEKKEQYINLDFAYLVELSRIDLYLREYLLQMCIDLEHALKVALIADTENNPNEDGYDIVTKFLQENECVLQKIAEKADSVYTGDLIEKYFQICYVFIKNSDSCTPTNGILKYRCPLWVLTELISFGDFLRLLRLYINTYPGRIDVDFKLLNIAKSLRNACAHNNCILVDLSENSAQPPRKISEEIAKYSCVTKGERKNKLTCRPLLEITVLLIEYRKHVFPKSGTNAGQKLKDFANNRMIENSHYFDGNPKVKSSLQFLKKIIDIF